jgi:phage tail sheath protein FI
MPRDAYYAPGVYVEEIPSARQPIAGVGTNTVGFIGAVPDAIWYPVRNPNYDPVMAQTLLAHRRLQAASQEGSDTDKAIALAQTEAQAEQLRARQLELQARKTALEARLAQLKDRATAAATTVTAAQTDLQQKETALSELEKTPPANEAAQAALIQARQQLEEANAKFLAANADTVNISNDLQASQDELNGVDHDLGTIGAELGGAAPAAEPAGAVLAPQFGEEDPDYSCIDNLDETAYKSLVQPSMFRPYYLERFPITVAEFDTKLCTNFSEYKALFGDYSFFVDSNPNEHDPSKKTFQPFYRGHHLLTHAVAGFFANGGTRCFVARVHPKNIGHWKDTLDQFESIEDVAILAAPGLPKNRDTWDALQTYCESDAHMNVFAILDSPLLVEDEHANLDTRKLQPTNPRALLPRRSAHAAFYFPHIEVMDPAKRLQDSDPAWGIEPKYHGLTYVAPSGSVAGIYARTDEERGVHKAPANATVRGALEVKYYVSRPKQELLNPQGVNCIRLMNGDVTVWGARNIGGDSLGEWKYVSVRRFAGFLEESISRGTQWVVFEPNDPSLWSKIILNITAFLTIVWRNGALFGLTPQEAFYVKCDEELNPPEVRDLGMVITEIGVAIVRPAEFVIFRITQSTGQRQG